MNKQSAWSTGKVVSGEAVMPSFVDKNGGTTLDYKNIIAYFTKQPGDSRLTSSNGFIIKLSILETIGDVSIIKSISCNSNNFNN